MLEYSVLAQTPLLRSRLDNFLYAAMDEAVVVPIWTDATRLTAVATSGTNTVTVATPYLDYDASTSVSDYYVILWASESSYEVVKVSSLNSTTLTLAENLVSTWPANSTIVAPAKLARIAQSVTGTQIAHDVRPYKIIFDIDESSPSVNRVTAITPDTYRSVDVYAPATEGGEDYEFGYDHPLTLIDAQTGVVGIDNGARTKPYLTIPYREIFATRAELSDWFGFLDLRQGRRVPFLFPSWEKDFTPTDIGFDYIEYTANGYYDWINMTDGRKDVAIMIERDILSFDPGDQVYKRITNVTSPGGGIERIYLNPNMSAFFSADYDKIRVSFLRYCRMASDTAEIAHVTNCISRVKTTFTELPESPA